MKNLILILIFSTSFAIAQINRPAGINLTAVNDYSTEYVFTDAMQQARPWIPFEDDFSAPWDSGVSIPLNAEGYPLEIPYNNGVNPPQLIRTILISDVNNYKPSGQYRLIITGQGQVRFWGAINVTYVTPIDVLVNIDASQGAVFLEIEQSLVADPISNIKFIYPEYVNNYQTQKFTTQLLDFIAPFQNIRFMDWTETNNATIETWSERSKDNYYTQATGLGVSWENVIELANTTQKDIWINIPHKADDNYITQLATLINTTLDSNLKIYLEYSNEIWNSIFDQHVYCAQAAQNLGYAGEEWERAWKYTSKRSADVFYIFETIFGNSDRFEKVLPTQMVAYVAGKIVEHFNDPVYNPNNVTADVLAIAPYFGGSIGDQLGSSGDYLTVTVPEIITLTENSLIDSYTETASLKIIADTNNLTIVAYEGGQHLVGNYPNSELQVLTDKLIAANRHIDMQTLYCQYFNNWYDIQNGGLFSVFSSHATPSKYGSWGIKEYMLNVNNPKYLGIENCIFSYNTLGVSNNEIVRNLYIYPNPTNDILNINKVENYKIFNALGELILKGKDKIIDIKELSKGIYFIHIDKQVKKIIKY